MSSTERDFKTKFNIQVNIYLKKNQKCNGKNDVLCKKKSQRNNNKKKENKMKKKSEKNDFQNNCYIEN